MSACRFGLAVLLLTAAARADDPKAEGWKGQLVVGKKPARDIQFGDVVDGKQVYFPFRGIYPQTVRDERDGWLRLFDGSREGWADKADFLLSRDATAYFTDRIRARPDDTFAWMMRGVAWYDRGESDNAVKDFTEVIRLDPKAADAYNGRGTAHASKKESDAAIRDYTEAVRLDPKYALPYHNRGIEWQVRKEFDKAIADYTEAIRLDPKYAEAFNGRGYSFRKKEQYDRAIADHTEAIRLDPNDASGFNGRGNVFLAKQERDKAFKDYAEAIRLDPKHVTARYFHSAIQITLRQPGAVKGFQTVLDLEGGKGELSTYAAIFGHLAAGLHDDAAAAKRFLGESAAKLSADWPFPVVRFLRGELDEAALLKAATDDDRRTEVRCFLGLDHLLNGRTAEAAAHFRWVKDHGNKKFVQYPVAVAELERLEKGKK